MKKLKGSLRDILHKPAPRRLKSKHDRQAQEGNDVVKGTARRVIVVRSPDPEVFEEAIFVVRDEYLRRGGVSQKELLRQARAAAKNYASSVAVKRRFSLFSGYAAPFIAAAGAAATGLAYVVLHLAGVC